MNYDAIKEAFRFAETQIDKAFLFLVDQMEEFEARLKRLEDDSMDDRTTADLKEENQQLLDEVKDLQERLDLACGYHNM